MIRRPPRSTPLYSSAASDVYKRQDIRGPRRLEAGRWCERGAERNRQRVDAGRRRHARGRRSHLPHHRRRRRAARVPPCQPSNQPATRRILASSLTFRIRRVCCHSNDTRTPIANPPISAQLGALPTIPQSYIRVRASVHVCGNGQSDTHTDTHTDRHRRPSSQYISFGYAMRNVISSIKLDR